MKAHTHKAGCRAEAVERVLGQGLTDRRRARRARGSSGPGTRPAKVLRAQAASWQ